MPQIMAPDQGTKWEPPLKAPAIEIIDLDSEDESANKGLNAAEDAKDRDASIEGSESEDDENSLWEEVLNEDEDQAVIHGSKIFPIINPLACKI